VEISLLCRTVALAGALLIAGCTSRPPPVPPPAREAVRPVGLDQTGLACISQAPEVVAAHHERAPMYGASSCDTRALDYAGAFGALGAIAALGIAASCAGAEDGVYVDIASVVRDRFVADLSPTPLGLKVSAPAPCPAGDAPSELQRSFGDRPVIDFKTVDWQKAKAGKLPVFVPATVRGRLVDLEAERVLWEEPCSIRAEPPAVDVETLRSSLERSAAVCAEHFAQLFSTQRQSKASDESGGERRDAPNGP
jgi:hypothetical protein